uniref:NADH-ubiquinone oxidoreductase chain 6 n=1 Tax=Cucujoidea sp. 15 KM-2017 TaxID=2219351 RepID=A0A346RH50_9CUCU|nr:NADH dehydrogenase subunit 6 [Cucujoidea sp. 15 KM-2017]
MLLLMMFFWLFNMIFIALNHPLTLGMILLIQTIIISLMTGLMNLNFWFSYMIFLIMVGGMLVLFMYMTNVASNEKFIYSFKMNIFIVTSMITFVIFLIMDYYFFNFNMNNQLMLKMNNFSNISLSMNKYFNFPMNMIYSLLIIYLFITLIAVVKITDINYGPLRQMK